MGLSREQLAADKKQRRFLSVSEEVVCFGRRPFLQDGREASVCGLSSRPAVAMTLDGHFFLPKDF